jgi:urease accessory protein
VLDLVGLRPRLQRGDGQADIGFVHAEGRTRLAHLHQRTPLRVLFPDSEPGEPMIAALVMTSGGIAGGDRLSVGIDAGAGACATVTGLAAEKVYRALGEPARSDVRLNVETGAWLEYLPQETILFDRARLQRRFEIDVAAEGRLLACDMVVFGRTASGERFRSGLWRDRWRLRQGGRLVWADAMQVEGLDTIDHPAGFAGASAHAMALYAGPDARHWLETARELATGCQRAAVTAIGNVLLARFLDADAAAVRRALAQYIAGLRQAVAGLPARPPRLWQF